MPEPQKNSFSVDTHVFRELGELLVGRDSTALLELIKNCYDADATIVTVSAIDLADAERGRIVIIDNGCGMDAERFRNGFLRIASRFKESGDRRSPHFQRRFTGSKGIGRLAAHKLAKYMEVDSTQGPPGELAKRAIYATIDWERIEAKDTLDELTDEITLTAQTRSKSSTVGTTITLSRLRRPWTDRERTRFVAECRSFQPPAILCEKLPTRLLGPPLLFSTPDLRDVSNKDPGYEIKLEGDFAEGDPHWVPLLAQSSWVLEIDCKSDKSVVRYAIAPTKTTIEEYPNAKRREYQHPHPNAPHGPYFQARILIRDAMGGLSDKAIREWSYQTSGVRVYMEGFRVLPYGEKRDDWLSLDANSSRRSWDKNPFTQQLVAEEEDEVGDWQLLVLPNNSYTGAVFLTQQDAPTLRMLVNREGFVAEHEYDLLVDFLKRGIDLSIRTRAAGTFKEREKRRAAKKQMAAPTSIPTGPLPKVSEFTTATATLLHSVKETRRLLASGGTEIPKEVSQQLNLVQSAAATVIRAGGESIDAAAMSRVLSSLGTQMASFVHEINGMLGTAIAVHDAIGRIREDSAIPQGVRRKLNSVYQSAGDLRRQIERQAAYMMEITSTDARRRRSRQPLAERFDAAARLVLPAVERRGIELRNDIPQTLKSPPMFPAEATVVFTNLLTNAVKAAGKGQAGVIWAHGKETSDGKTLIVVENTGDKVDLFDAERWFQPFESTTTEVDSFLGRGMGLGLTITRDILEQYGATISFVAPSKQYATAIEIQFSEQKENP